MLSKRRSGYRWVIAFVFPMLLATAPVAESISSGVAEAGIPNGRGSAEAQSLLQKWRAYSDTNCRYYYGELYWVQLLYYYLTGHIQSYERGQTCVTISSVLDLP